MPRRNRDSTRRQAHRTPRTTVLIFCGAGCTEKDYFAGLRTFIGSRSIDIVVTERSGSPDQVVGYAAAYGSGRDFEERWCIVDVDHFEREGGKVSKAVAKGRAAGINVAVSNPCFEYWLLIHHADKAFPAHVCQDIDQALRKEVPDYDKTCLRFEQFADGVPDAIKRAKKRDPSGTEHGINPSSGVWVLVEKLMEQQL
jgi:hypothetical protein